jgi:hypothetical protein
MIPTRCYLPDLRIKYVAERVKPATFHRANKIKGLNVSGLRCHKSGMDNMPANNPHMWITAKMAIPIWVHRLPNYSLTTKNCGHAPLSITVTPEELTS